MKFFLIPKINKSSCNFIVICVHLSLLTFVVNKRLTSIENHLDSLQQQSCKGFLSLQELTEAVKTLDLGKSPSSDGFSVEFYLHFWEILGPLLLRVANHCFRDGNLCDSMKGSVTRLIYKKRGDIKSLKNWRPISLLP